MGRAQPQEYVKYGVLEGVLVVPGIALPAHPSPPHPGYTSPLPAGHHDRCYRSRRRTRGLNIAVGLKSVAQLSLCAHFSLLRGITEVYNLVKVDNR